MYTFEGKVAFVTGALGVIGKAYVKYLWQNNVKGIAHIDLHEQDATYAKELDTKYGKSNNLFLQVNIANKTELKDAFEATVKHFEQLDIVINNAGICNEDDYELTLQTNFMGEVHGTMFAMNEYLPKYKKGPGVIVNTSSFNGIYADQYLATYSLSKHAIVAIGLNYAKTPANLEKDIRILTICPFGVISPIQKNAASYVRKSERPSSGLSVYISKTADYLGEGLIKFIKEGNNGAVWLFMEGKEPANVNYQPIHDMALNYIRD